MGNLAKRVISALILLPPVLYIIYKGYVFIDILVSLVVLLCGLEFYKMFRFKSGEIIFALIFTLLAYFGLSCFVDISIFILTGVFVCAGLYVLFSLKEINGSSAKASYLFLGIFYTGIFPAFIPLIRKFDAENGFYYLLSFLAVIWLSDTFAYFVGRSIGRHKLYEMVSPKKTIEGSIAGILGGILGVYIIALFFGKYPSSLFVLLVGVFVNLIGQAGDLFESMFKRDAGIKDSGNLIPGHGGMLDRVDAIIFAAPVMYIVIRFIL